MTQSGEAADRPAKVVVVGSVNMDLIARVAALPRAGQTVAGRDLIESPGGKGANQAVAAARLGARVTFIGRVGDDDFGRRLREGLSREQIDTHHVLVTASCSSGVAIVCVEESGENAIVVTSGANAHLAPEDIARSEAVIAGADVLLVQLETPLETVRAAINAARRHAVPTVLDPAPATTSLPDELLRVDVLCPNESEAAAVSGIAVHSVDDAARAGRQLRQRGARNAVITLGRHGAFLCDQSGGCEQVSSFAVSAIDTTAAGDAFAAALGVALAETGDLKRGVTWGCAAGALAASTLGAQLAMPTRAEVLRLLQDGGQPASAGASRAAGDADANDAPGEL